MKNRGRSPAGSKAKDYRGSGGSSGRSIASDHEHEAVVEQTPQGGMASLTVTSALAAATADEALAISGVSSNVSPSHHLAAPGGSDTADSSSLGNSIFYDDPDALAQLMGSPDPALTQKAIEQYQAKIVRTKEQIKEVQTSLDDNVNEYLKLSANAADGVQQQRIKQVFEKKNQKSAQSIAQFQKKLDEYTRKLRDLEKYGVQTRDRPVAQQKMRDLSQGLKHVGGNIRDGITGMSSSVMSKPKEFAHLLRHKFGSADNLNSMSQKEQGSPGNNSGTEDKKDKRNHHGSASLPREGGSGGAGGSLTERQTSSFEERRKCLSEDGGMRRPSADVSEVSEATSESVPHQPSTQQSQQEQQQQQPVVMVGSPQRRTEDATEWNAVMQELTLHKEEVDRLREEMDDLRQQFKQEVEALSYQLRDERDSCARLEEQINDLTELHQHEIENIKTGVNDMEEKVQYQSEERLLDIKEHLQSLETKVTSMEHQQVQQQYLNIEGLDSTDARAIMMKLLNAVITFVHVILFFIGTVMNLTKPFLRTTPRMVTTAIVAFVSVVAYYKQDMVFALMVKLKQNRTEDS